MWNTGARTIAITTILKHSLKRNLDTSGHCQKIWLNFFHVQQSSKWLFEYIKLFKRYVMQVYYLWRYTAYSRQISTGSIFFDMMHGCTFVPWICPWPSIFAVTFQAIHKTNYALASHGKMRIICQEMGEIHGEPNFCFLSAFAHFAIHWIHIYTYCLFFYSQCLVTRECHIVFGDQWYYHWVFWRRLLFLVAEQSSFYYPLNITAQFEVSNWSKVEE